MPESTSGTVIDPPKPVTNFTLTSHTGAHVSLSDLQGRQVLLFFGYTNCPDVCPLTLSEWKKVKGMLGGDAKNVAFVFVGVDIKRDTPEALARFIGTYDPTFLGLAADEATLKAFGKDYGLYLKHHDDGHDDNPMVDHSPASYLLDADGRLRMVYSYGVPADVISDDIRTFVAQR